MAGEVYKNGSILASLRHGMRSRQRLTIRRPSKLVQTELLVRHIGSARWVVGIIFLPVPTDGRGVPYIKALVMIHTTHAAHYMETVDFVNP